MKLCWYIKTCSLIIFLHVYILVMYPHFWELIKLHLAYILVPYVHQSLLDMSLDKTELLVKYAFLRNFFYTSDVTALRVIGI